MDYKERFLRCVEEGYDAAKLAMYHGERVECPYTLPEENYEYNAWNSGADWYLSEVH